MFGPQTMIRLRILLKEPAIEAFRGEKAFSSISFIMVLRTKQLIKTKPDKLFRQNLL